MHCAEKIKTRLILTKNVAHNQKDFGFATAKLRKNMRLGNITKPDRRLSHLAKCAISK